MAYVATEKYEQQYCLDHHKTVFDDFKKHARIEAVKDTNSVILSLQESIYSVQVSYLFVISLINFNILANSFKFLLEICTKQIRYHNQSDAFYKAFNY